LIPPSIEPCPAAPLKLELVGALPTIQYRPNHHYVGELEVKIIGLSAVPCALFLILL
jgi:hypothetical protein